MTPTDHAPNGTAELLVGLVAALFIIIGLVIRWFRDGQTKPNPWETAAVEAPPVSETAEEIPICIRCLTPHTETAYFCPHCGHAVGPYNNWMPYLQLFSEGEMWRAATAPDLRPRPIIVVGYALLTLPLLAVSLVGPFWLSDGGSLLTFSSLAWPGFGLFVIAFWIVLLKNLLRPRPDPNQTLAPPPTA